VPMPVGLYMQGLHRPTYRSKGVCAILTVVIVQAVGSVHHTLLVNLRQPGNAQQGYMYSQQST
jgi:hypothetical protein